MNNKKMSASQRPHLGQGLVEYALILGLVSLIVGGVLVVVGPSLGNVYSQVVGNLAGEPQSPGHVVVSVVDEAGKGIENVRVYAFNERGRYTGKFGNTDANGDLSFMDLPDGTYQFRADYQRLKFWSNALQWPKKWHATIKTRQRPFTVKVVDQGQAGIENVRVYAFNEKNQYVGINGNTDENGNVKLDLVVGSFKFRADYRSNKYWSAIVNSGSTNNTIVETGERPFTVRVVDSGQVGIENVRVYVFNERGNYVSLYGNTSADGSLEVNLPDGNFKFRVDYRGQRYWSDLVNSPGMNEAVVETGQQPFTIKVLNAANNPLPNVRVYAFNENGNYIGLNGNTDAGGALTLDLPDGNFKFRANYRGQTYWSEVATSPDVNTISIQTGEQTFTVHVVDSGSLGINNVRVYVFNDRDQYTGIFGNTDSSGVIALEIPEGQFKFRADYRGHRYWSILSTVPGSGSATVMTGERPFTVTVEDNNGQPLNGIRVYAFNESGQYTGVYGNTDSSGDVILLIPNGSFKFRAHYNNQRYWSSVITTPTQTITTITTD
jgi:pilus assembly protein Flp/PilA